MNRGLSAEQLGGLLDERHLATLATVRKDGMFVRVEPGDTRGWDFADDLADMGVL